MRWTPGRFLIGCWLAATLAAPARAADQGGEAAPPTAAPPAAAPALAPPAGPLVPPLDEYWDGALVLKQSFWSGTDVYRNGKRLDLGFLGGNYDEVFAGSPAALDAAGTSHVLAVTGFVTYVTGLAALVVSLVGFAAQGEGFIETSRVGGGTQQRPSALTWGLLGGGAALGLTGSLLLSSSGGYLTDAVDAFNTDLYRKLGGQLSDSGGGGPALVVRVGGEF